MKANIYAIVFGIVAAIVAIAAVSTIVFNQNQPYASTVGLQN